MSFIPKMPSLATRCLALTGSFETGALPPECFGVSAGDFDGQFLSFGALQWNFGQQTLQPLLTEAIEQFPGLCRQVFGKHLVSLKQALDSDLEKQAQLARSIQNSKSHQLDPIWTAMFARFGRSQEGQLLQTQHATTYWQRACRLCADFELDSERGAALMFDIAVQNGSISRMTSQLIRDDFRSLPLNPDWSDHEQAKLEIIANRRAEDASPRWIEDVRLRKLTIAQGKGAVHGQRYDLEKDFKIALRKTSQR